MKKIGDRYYALRGYVLVLLSVPLMIARLQSPDPVIGPWLLLVLGGVLLRLWAGAHIGPHSNGIALSAGPRAQTGPYRFLLHPLYLSNLAVAAGLIGYSNSLSLFSAAVLWMFCLVHHLVLIRIENSLAIAQSVPASPVGWKTALNRQARNIAYTFACVALLSWISSFSLTLFP